MYVSGSCQVISVVLVECFFLPLPFLFFWGGGGGRLWGSGGGLRGEGGGGIYFYLSTTLSPPE